MAALEARSAAGPAEDIPAPKEPFAKLLRRERVLEERLKLQAAGVHLPLAALVDYSEFGLDVAFDEAVYPPDYIAAVRAAVGPLYPPPPLSDGLALLLITSETLKIKIIYRVILLGIDTLSQETPNPREYSRANERERPSTAMSRSSNAVGTPHHHSLMDIQRSSSAPKSVAIGASFGTARL
ncbi:hypothetical protein PAPYR_11815 [Paratrimastix pyriformis]|uniref:Uncharacterized protein n=1 Tax=Paratrimastix pyriformis TaxID=342808 RepID=A0ABQ8U6R4_9EUKA|nr:hypothetical protein PAPYR_11815 [Paratrimastix pyriformis]